MWGCGREGAVERVLVGSPTIHGPWDQGKALGQLSAAQMYTLALGPQASRETRIHSP